MRTYPVRQSLRVSPIVSALLVFASGASAQDKIPMRTIGPILATSTENVGLAVTVRGNSDGHVIVGAGARQRVYAFDSTLQHFTIVADSGAGTGVLRTSGRTRSSFSTRPGRWSAQWRRLTLRT